MVEAEHISNEENRDPEVILAASRAKKEVPMITEEDATARRYDKSERDLSGEPRAERAGEGGADDERSEEDATARRGGADDERSEEDATARRGGADDERSEEDAAAESQDWPTQPEGQLTVDVYQTPSEIVIQSTIAGVKPENLDITIANDMVSIRGKRVREDRVPEENFYYQECYWGPFARSVILPAEVKGGDAEASIKHGILTIRLPKAEKEKLKKIPVRVV